LETRNDRVPNWHFIESFYATCIRHLFDTSFAIGSQARRLSISLLRRAFLWPPPNIVPVEPYLNSCIMVSSLPSTYDPIFHISEVFRSRDGLRLRVLCGTTTTTAQAHNLYANLIRGSHVAQQTRVSVLRKAYIRWYENGNPPAAFGKCLRAHYIQYLLGPSCG
jgi:hypothetical protein